MQRERDREREEGAGGVANWQSSGKKWNNKKQRATRLARNRRSIRNRHSRRSRRRQERWRRGRWRRTWCRRATGKKPHIVVDSWPRAAVARVARSNSLREKIEEEEEKQAGGRGLLGLAAPQSGSASASACVTSCTATTRAARLLQFSSPSPTSSSFSSLFTPDQTKTASSSCRLCSRN